ncbi:MAG: HD domain-containing protein [Candidatus Spechtbacterales bacterium]|nr:HD domain-containing protein [Candidatus Spechtbacterales bacterium]
MKYRHKNVKLIYDPLWGLIDITRFLPMIDTPEFQALGFKYQLGVTSQLFPAATHTRKQHSFGAFKRAQDLSENWLKKGFIKKEDARLIEAYALWHDIGHGPFSHVVEAVTREFWKRDHDENGALIINRLKGAVEAADIDFKKFKEFFDHKNPLYLAVHDKNLGAEKLDYLSRDAYYTIGERPGVEYLAKHTYFIDGEIMIDEKAIENAKALQEFYIKMYKVVYLRKNSAIAQRMVQRMSHELVQHEHLSEEEFWGLTDFGLLGLLENTTRDSTRKQMKRFMQRDLPRTAVALKLEHFAEIERRKDKAQAIFGIRESQMEKLLRSETLSSPSKIRKVEKEIESIAKLPQKSILIVPSSSSQRFKAKDIKIFIPGGKKAKLSDYFAEHFHAMEEEGKSYSTIRVCTYTEHREKLSNKKTAEAVKEYLLSLIS